MTIVRYKNEQELVLSAEIYGIDTYKTDASISFRIYHPSGITKEFHVFYFM